MDEPVDVPLALGYAAKSMKPKRKIPRKSSRGKPGGGPRKPGAGQPAARAETTVRVRRVVGDGPPAWEFVHPRCAVARADDIDEVRQMVEHGEVEIATDELRWLLNGCSDFIDAHRLLGELALGAEDFPLARGHFGYAYRIGQVALKQAGSPAPLPYARSANQAFFEAGKGLAFCLKQLNKRDMAADVVALLLRCDPSDPLGVKNLLA
jgi:hypothetical protein